MHFLSIEELSGPHLLALLESATKLKAERSNHEEFPLADQTWGMIFTKASTRTRVSFEVGIRELGGNVIFLSSNDIQLGRGEPIKDTARVLGRMIHGCIIRTFDQQDVVDFAEYSGIPTINALTDEEHPCQILADLLTIQEQFGTLEGLKIAYLGDSDNNMATSWIWAAKHLGLEFHLAGPDGWLPREELMQRVDCDHIHIGSDAASAVKNADVIMTDVWLSMGQEAEGAEKERHFAPYQVNEALLEQANSGHIVLHCLPAYRDKEISESTLEHHAETIFRQAENRLHAQKAILCELAD